MWDMSQISVECQDHYTVVSGLNHRKLKDSLAEDWSLHWKSIEDCFRDIHHFDAGYKRAKGYCRADFNIQEASTIKKVNSTKDPELCFR